MSKGLEAFNDLIYNYEHLEKERFNEDCKIVINELKALEIIKNKCINITLKEINKEEKEILESVLEKEVEEVLKE